VSFVPGESHTRPEDLDRDRGPEGLDAVPGLARIALSAWWHTTGWAVRSSIRIPQHAIDLARSPDKAAAFAREALETLAARASNGGVTAEQVAEPSRNGSTADPRPAAPSSLREEGEELLRRSRDVHYEVDAHPAYGRILSELAPDEGRILRLLLLEGPQPAIDIRTGGPVGLVRSRLIAPGLSMIGARAGCKYVDRVPSYLNNLFRLGLIWFSRETLRDPLRYQVLEAQPDVLAALNSVRYAKVVRRSVHLTPFGDDFCRVCLASDAGVLDALPEHSTPNDTATTPQPPNEGTSLDRTF
jgi:Abortive infection alpha